MTLFADVPPQIFWSSLIPARSKKAKANKNLTSESERQAICARRAFMNEKMCEAAVAVEGEFGMQAMMSVYPKHF